MTAVEWLMNRLEFAGIKDLDLCDDIYLQSKQMEKEQIIDAATWGTLSQSAEHYYTDKYGSKGSDDKKINLVEIPQEQLEKERNPNYKYFDIDEHTSSQTEISDEEIKEAAKDYHWKNGVYYAQEKTFIDAIKWYREQIKSI